MPLAPQKQDSTSDTFSSLLDGMRWIAAALVALSHIRALSWVQGSAIEHSNVAIKIFYAMTSTGVEAVAVFFVLSGFLVGGVNYSRFLQGKFDISRYAIDRVTRIYTVLIPVLLIVALLDFAGRQWFAGSLYYTAGNVLIAERFGVFNTPSVTGFLVNVVALQDFYAPVFGSDIPLWSLSYEIWFYVLAAAVFVAASSRQPVRIVVAVGIVAVVALLGLKFVFFLILWLIGVAAQRLSRPRRSPSSLVRYAILALLPLTMLASAQVHTVVRLGEVEVKPLLVAVALVCGLTLVAWRHADAAVMRRSRRLNASLASFSFTLYLIHFPAAVLVVAGIVALSVPDAQAFAGFQPLSIQGLSVFAGATGVALVLAIASAAITEWRTAVIRARVLRMMKR